MSEKPLSRIRDFFIERIYPVVETKSLVDTEERLVRYHKLLAFYLDMFSKNECQCFGSVDDILAELEKTQHENRMYIRHGFRPKVSR